MTGPSPAGSTATGIPLLELRDLTVSFGTVAALSRVSLRLDVGEVCCVLGENGSGKSTLVAALSGLQRHHASCCSRWSPPVTRDWRWCS